jgi:hypothetical protein
MRCFNKYFYLNKLVYASFFHVLVTCFFHLSVNAQFVDVSNNLQLSTDHTGGFLGTGVSFADFNGDYIDDLTFGHHAGQIRYYQGNGIGFEEIQLNIDNDVNESKSVLWADFDNDGDQDLLITNRYASNRLWMNNGNMQFTDISSTCGISTTPDSKSYGASFGDYDNDGFLDLYICNYHSQIVNIQNELYHNNGDGTFTDVTQNSGVGNGSQESFQSTWIDIDQDGLLDLHVVNDRIAMLNAFYRNNGDGTFSDMASIWNVDAGIYAMNSCFGDYDRDGDMDLYVTNGPAGNRMFLNQFNESMSFVDVTQYEGVAVNQLCWGACFIDHENDTWLDLYVATGISFYTVVPEVFESHGVIHNVFFSSSGSSPLLSFSEEIPNSDQYGFSIAKGDYNNDGFPDLVSHSIGDHATVLSATPNGNHFLKVMPQGSSSNRDAVGAEVLVYHSDGQDTGLNEVELDVVFCGDKYLSQNSRFLHFGLGSSTQIDSVVIQWPGGMSESFKWLEIDDSVVLIEGTSNQYCPSPSSFCGTNTAWDPETEKCISVIELNPCETDLDFDGQTAVSDLILLLSQFGTLCTQ